MRYSARRGPALRAARFPPARGERAEGCDRPQAEQPSHRGTHRGGDPQGLSSCRQTHRTRDPRTPARSGARDLRPGDNGLWPGLDRDPLRPWPRKDKGRAASVARRSEGAIPTLGSSDPPPLGTRVSGLFPGGAAARTATGRPLLDHMASPHSLAEPDEALREREHLVHRLRLARRAGLPPQTGQQKSSQNADFSFTDRSVAPAACASTSTCSRRQTPSGPSPREIILERSVYGFSHVAPAGSRLVQT